MSVLSFFNSPFNFEYALTNVTPPPITIPSFIADFVAFKASSSLNFFSFLSVSVAPPTFKIAIPLLMFPKRSFSFFLS